MKRDDELERGQETLGATLSDREEEKIAAFCDGELHGKEADALRERLESGDALYTTAIKECREVGDELRSWLNAERLDASGSARDLNIWDGIEGQILEADPSSHGVAVRTGAALSGALRNIRQIFFPAELAVFFQPQVAGAFSAVALLALYAGILIGGDGESPIVAESNAPEQKLASASESVESLKQDRIPLVALVGGTSAVAGSRAGRQLVASVPSGANATSGKFFKRSLPLDIGSSGFDWTSQLIGASSRAIKSRSKRVLSGGLRTDGTEIDWIKSKRPFKIIPSSGRKAPPVIWVSGERNSR